MGTLCTLVSLRSILNKTPPPELFLNDLLAAQFLVLVGARVSLRVDLHVGQVLQRVLRRELFGQLLRGRVDDALQVLDRLLHGGDGADDWVREVVAGKLGESFQELHI